MTLENFRNKPYMTGPVTWAVEAFREARPGQSEDVLRRIEQGAEAWASDRKKREREFQLPLEGRIDNLASMFPPKERQVFVETYRRKEREFLARVAEVDDNMPNLSEAPAERKSEQQLRYEIRERHQPFIGEGGILPTDTLLETIEGMKVFADRLAEALKPFVRTSLSYLQIGKEFVSRLNIYDKFKIPSFKRRVLDPATSSPRF